MDVKKERINRILQLKEILLSFQIGINLVDNAAVVCVILETISDLEPSPVTTKPMQVLGACDCLKLLVHLL